MEFKGNIRDVVGYEGLYKVSDLGIVYSLRTWNGVSKRSLIPHINSFGYPRFSLTKDGKTRKITAHNLTRQMGRIPRRGNLHQLNIHQ